MPDALARVRREQQIDALVRVGVDPEEARLHVDAVLAESAAAYMRGARVWEQAVRAAAAAR